MRNTTKQMRGSVLVFSLLVLFILLSMTMSTASVLTVDLNSINSTIHSNMAYQVADGAVENVIKRIYKNPGSDLDLNALASNILKAGGQPDPVCANGVIHGFLPTSTKGEYYVTFLDNGGVKLSCNDNSWRSKLVYLTVQGKYRGVTRAIYVGVKQ